jgi:hypothetical protein
MTAWSGVSGKLNKFGCSKHSGPESDSGFAITEAGTDSGETPSKDGCVLC